jgi:hypothetical protein
VNAPQDPDEPEPILGVALADEPPGPTPFAQAILISEGPPPLARSTPSQTRLESVASKPPALPSAPAPAPTMPPPLPSTAQRVPSAPSFRIPARPAEPPRPAPAPPQRLATSVVEAPPPLRSGLPTLPHLPAARGVGAKDLPEADAEDLAEVEPEEIIGEELPDSAEAAGPSGPELPESALDPWFAQLAHGYCPPEGARFTRHTPPTNFPGRDVDSDPTRQPPSPHAQGLGRKNGS